MKGWARLTAIVVLGWALAACAPPPPLVVTATPIGGVTATATPRGPTATALVLPPTFTPIIPTATVPPPTLTPAPTRTPVPTSDGGSTLFIGSAGGGDDEEGEGSAEEPGGGEEEPGLIGGLPGSRPEFGTTLGVQPGIDPNLPLYGTGVGVEVVLVQRLLTDTAITATLGAGFNNDAHNWLVSGSAGQYVEIALEADRDVDVWLYGPDGALLTGDINDELTVFVYRLPASGAYTIQVASNVFETAYVLRASVFTSDLPFYTNGEPTVERTASSASVSGTNTWFVRRLDPGGAVQAEFARDFTAHNWVFSGQDGDQMTVTVDADDLSVQLLGPDGVEVDRWMNDTTMTVRLRASGLYTLRVDRFDSGPYTIQLTLE